MQFAQRLRDTADEELVTPLGKFVAAAYRFPDLAEELDRADEDAEAEVDEETPIALTATTTAESPRQSGASSNKRILSCLEMWPLPTLCCQMGKTLFQMSRVRSTTDAENSASSSFAEMLPFQPSLWHRHDGSSESVGSRKPKEYRTSSVMGHAGHDSYRDLFHTATVLAQTL